MMDAIILALTHFVCCACGLVLGGLCMVLGALNQLKKNGLKMTAEGLIVKL